MVDGALGRMDPPSVPGQRDPRCHVLRLAVLTEAVSDLETIRCAWSSHAVVARSVSHEPLLPPAPRLPFAPY